jgi:vacuolar protein-sorting-associated protein 4
MVSNSNILLLGATNMPWALDAAMLRRLQRKIYIPLPEEETRAYMFSKEIMKKKTNITQEEIIKLA